MNLLTDHLLSVEDGRRLSLPELFAALARGEAQGFPRLRAHQRTAWHMFRVQLAALALDRAGRTDLPATSEAWAALLRALSAAESGDEGDAPWCLTVADRTKPAFLQPPDPGGLKWSAVATPDALDLLITARNHDLKAEVAADAAPEDWIYALVSLQTMEGYGGKSNYGIARMNGGSSSRAFLGLVPARGDGYPDVAAWWRRDVERLLAHRSEPGPLTRGGLALLWCHPWPEGRSLRVNTIDPWAIEVCRRVRLAGTPSQLHAERAGSAAARLDAKSLNGALGDPWAPVAIDEAQPKALTLGEGRFDYRRLVALLFAGKWKVPLAARLDGDEGADGMLLLAEALSRGNSKTDGLKSRLVPLPRKVVAGGWFSVRAEMLARAAGQQIQEIAYADAALREAVALYAADGDFVEVGKEERQRAGPARARLDAAADDAFFDYLWDRADAVTEEAARIGFCTLLTEAAEWELERAFAALPCAALFAARARVRARRRLRNALRKAELLQPEAADA
ncbi:hypothetical protein [Methylobacterium thuringiense]|uniref:CRISPR-associated protein Cse1 n=1 Tax=Methylobacterium thuringiense TaxID=1003091 RepID=A0ABQ4TW81_9HYPH|nr:hypothetical protein [Methylobacterium thuringiense]GJE57845.1 hypothetical protein EKPJFOCH_4367 [Methylobacterium thuringiense]